MDLWTQGQWLPSPIRIDHVKPLKKGTSEVEVGFFHACYPEGVQDKAYRLQVLHRSEHDLIVVRVDADDRQTLRIAPLTRNWLAKLSGIPVLVALASGDDADLGAQLNRLFSGGIRL